MLFTGGATLYANSNPSLLRLDQSWTNTEFNVFGACCNGEANFMNGAATIVVQLLTHSVGSEAPPGCVPGGTTAESNNLTLVPNSCCTVGGPTPGIQFTESNVSNPMAQPCPPSLPATVGFEPAVQWSSFFCQNGEVCAAADVNGDHLTDVVAFSAGVGGQNAAFVGLSNGGAFQAAQQWSSFFCQAGEVCELADVNGDGKADAIAFNHGLNGQNNVYVALSSGTSFGSPQAWSSFFCQSGEVCRVADVNGDGKADVIAFNYGLNGANAVYVGLSNGSSFGSPQEWSTFFCLNGEDCEVADVNGDRQSDLIAYNHGLNGGTAAFVGLSNGSSFGSPQQWSGDMCVAGEVCGAADFNGDNLADAVAFNHGNNGGTAVFTGLSTGASFTPAYEADGFFCLAGETCATGDVNGDGLADLISFTRGSSPQVFVGQSVR
jgi:hypothetical protein